MDKTFEELCREVAAWNAWVSAPQYYKNGRVKPKRKKPIDALAAVRGWTSERLVWDEETKRRAVDQLLEEQEARQAEGLADE